MGTSVLHLIGRMCLLLKTLVDSSYWGTEDGYFDAYGWHCEMSGKHGGRFCHFAFLPVQHSNFTKPTNEKYERAQMTSISVVDPGRRYPGSNDHEVLARVSEPTVEQCSALGYVVSVLGSLSLKSAGLISSAACSVPALAGLESGPHTGFTRRNLSIAPWNMNFGSLSVAHNQDSQCGA